MSSTQAGKNKRTSSSVRSPWKPGQSGNPAGRPKKGETLSDLLEARGEEVIEYRTRRENVKLKRKDALARKLWDLALGGKGNLKAIMYIFDRLAGPPVKAIELSGSDGGPIRIVATTADEAL